MRKQILSWLLATAALLTFTGSSNAERWGWSDLERMWSTDAMAAPAGAAQALPVSVVPVEVDPVTLKAPGVLASALPPLEDALAAIRVVVEDDPVLLGTLRARGLSAEDVVGLSHSRDGITLFVRNA